MQMSHGLAIGRFALRNPIIKGIALGVFVTLVVGCGGEENKPNGAKPVTTKPTPPSSVLTFANNGIITVKEGNKDTTANVKVTLRLSRVHSENIELNYETVDVSATAGVDYLQSAGKLVIPKGAIESSLSFTVFGDDRYEINESFDIKFSPVSGTKDITFDKTTVRVEITNDDAMPVAQFKSTNVTVAEDVGKIDLIVGLDRDSDLETKINLEYSGLATLGSDYLSEATEVIFEPGEVSKIITLDIIKDDIIEGGEQIKVRLNTPLNATIGKNSSSTVLILGDLAFPDTGVLNAYADGDFNSNVADQLHPYQDNLYGLDSVQNEPSDGYAGMVYTKIDKSGNPLARNSNEAACVFDANTGLTWENKMQPVVIPDKPYRSNEEELAIVFEMWRSQSYKYFWHTEDKTNDGGSAGGSDIKMFVPYGSVSYPYAPKACAFPNKDSALYERPSNGCTTDTYVALVKKSNLCGFKSWRLPTINELMSLVIYEDNKPTLDTFYFDDMQGDDARFYLSGTPSAENDGSVWCLNVKDKRAQLCLKNEFNEVRLVRGNKL